MNWKMSSRVFLVVTYVVLLSVPSVLLVSCGGGGGDGDGGPVFIAPAVSQTTPEANSTNIPVMTIVGVELNDVVDAKTITQGTLSVVSSSGAVSGTVVYSGKVITFQPDTPFEYDTGYTAILSADIESLDGVPLSTEYAWEFTTVATGPGDPSNYIPFEQGSTWEYQSTSTETGMDPINYINEIRINGVKIINGKSTSVFIESNFDNAGIPIEVYLIKDLNGVTNYGDNDLSDTLTPQITPYQETNFPATPGYSFIQTHKAGLDFGEDVDFDGVNETFDLLSTVTVVRLETVTVPAGTFVDCALVETDIFMEVRVSSDNSLYKFHGLGSAWYAPDVGLVKTIEDMSDPDGNTYSVSEVLTDYLLVIPPLILPTNDLIYDPFIQMIYASVPSRAGINGNSIAVLNPVTTLVEDYISIGSEPEKLALADDGSYLYVAFDGNSTVKRLDLMAPNGPIVDLEFSLGSDASFIPYYVEDMEVLPGTPNSVAISRKYLGLSPKHAGVAIYNNGIQLVTTTPGHTGSNVIEFSSSSATLYGYNNETTEWGFREMTTATDGVTVASTTGGLINNFGANIEFENGLVFSTNGKIIDPVAKMVTFDLLINGIIETDSSLGRHFVLTHDTPSTLKAFNLTDFGEVWSLGLRNVQGVPGSLIRWGGDGLAFRTDEDQVFFVTFPYP